MPKINDLIYCYNDKAVLMKKWHDAFLKTIEQKLKFREEC